jgi:hypothetical protein
LHRFGECFGADTPKQHEAARDCRSAARHAAAAPRYASVHRQPGCTLQRPNGSVLRARRLRPAVDFGDP